MTEKTVLTVAELAKRWQCSESAIRSMVSTRNLKTVHDAPGVRFLVKYIEEREAIGLELDPLSPFERRRLEKERDYWKERAESFENILKKIRVDTAVVIRWLIISSI